MMMIDGMIHQKKRSPQRASGPHGSHTGKLRGHKGSMVANQRPDALPGTSPSNAERPQYVALDESGMRRTESGEMLAFSRTEKFKTS